MGVVCKEGWGKNKSDLPNNSQRREVAQKQKEVDSEFILCTAVSLGEGVELPLNSAGHAKLSPRVRKRWLPTGKTMSPVLEETQGKAQSSCCSWS